MTGNLEPNDADPAFPLKREKAAIVKEWLIRCALVAASVLAGLALTETYFRHVPSLESSFLDPALTSAAWQLDYLRDYKAFAARKLIGSDLTGYVHDPELGWDTPGHFRGGRTYSVDKPQDGIRIATIGDSYTYGAEVDEDQSYPARLQRRLHSAEVLNMGVKAYGIDQAALKYMKYGKQYRPDVIVFGIFGPDYHRTLLTFFRFAKPLFRLDPQGGVALSNTPLPTPEQAYKDLRRVIQPLTYTATQLQVAYHKVFDDYDRTEFFRRWDPLVENVLELLVKRASDDGTKIIFMYIPTGDEAVAGVPFGKSCCERVHLIGIWRRLAQRYNFIDIIDLMDELPSKVSDRSFYEELIIHQGGKPSGHFTPLGNEAVATIVSERLAQRYGIRLSTGPIQPLPAQ